MTSPPLLRLVPVLATVLAVLGTPPASVEAGAGAGAPMTSSSGGSTGASTGASRGPVPSAGRWAWPLSPRPVVWARFAAPPGPYAAGHRGDDLRAVPGQEVLSPTDGLVTFAGLVAGRPVVVVTHADGLRSTFEPVVAGPSVGTHVGRGDPVGTVAGGDEPGGPTGSAWSASHCAPLTCVHWGVLRGDTYLDPLGLVGTVRVVLLPLRP